MRKSRVFQNYHRHTHYTNPKVSDSIARNEDYAKRAAELGHGIISSCEHGYQGRYIECHELAEKHGLKFLFGAEAYWVNDRKEADRTNCHIFLGARNEKGRQAINDALSEANISGFHYQARLDRELILSLPPQDVIVTSACIAFWKYNDVDSFVEQLHDHFRGNFFLEVQYHNTESQRTLNQRILQLHNALKIPIIMGCDSHYIHPEDGIERDDFLVSKGMVYDDEEGWYLDYPNGDEAYRRFAEQCVLSHQEIIDAMDNTNVFLDVEKYDNPCFNTEIKMPTLHPDWSQKQRDAEYRRLVMQGFDAYRPQILDDQVQHYLDETNREMDIVAETKMSDYFIDNYHIIRRGKELGGHLTMSGRGSGPSFFTNMLLGFTDIDRISAKVKMYPERFMSATRILQTKNLPDIDFNVADAAPFAQAQKDVLGDDHAYPMIAYGTMKKSSAWKMFAKSQGINFEIANEVSNQIKRYEMALNRAEEDEKGDIDPLDFIDLEFHEIFKRSEVYQGIITSWSIAPCSYLLYQGSIRKEIGLVRIKDNLCCLMDGKWAEVYHFLKNDLLTVKVVDLIYRAYAQLGREPDSVNELLQLCPPDDPAWDVYKKGCTLGINQCEQPGTSSRVGKFNPKNISEICAFVAAIRPGFKSMYKIFESREPFQYGIKAFDNLLATPEMPSSFCLYQEQQMNALNFSGLDMSECYTAIKNIAKKRVEKVLAYKTVFLNGFKQAIVEQDGLPPDVADEKAHMVWQIIEDSSRYSFNASHSYCVAIDSLYGAYLKAHHPLEFYSAFMQIQEKKGDKDKLTAARVEAEEYFKIHFQPYRFGQDNRDITVDREHFAINNSLSAIKGFGKAVGETIYEVGQRPHETFMELLMDLDAHGLKSSKVEPLIKIDYFAQYGNSAELLRMNGLFEFSSAAWQKASGRTSLAKARCGIL